MHKVQIIINLFDLDIYTAVENYYNNPSEENKNKIKKIFYFIWEITPKINVLNKQKLFHSFLASSEGKLKNKESLFFKKICNNICGIKKKWEVVWENSL